MELKKRIELLESLGSWFLEDGPEWEEILENAYQQNKWFTREFVELRRKIIAANYLAPEKLRKWVYHYRLDDPAEAREIGVIMPGNIPLEGFHDLLAVFITGHHAHIKLSEKDHVLVKEILKKMKEMDSDTGNYLSTSDMLRGCDAYIASVNKEKAHFFDHYFGKYPSIIRKKKTSVAILTGNESKEQLESLADDVFIYFGLGIHSVSRLHVPKGYNFVPLLEAFDKFKYFEKMDRYKNYYDYNLSLLIMNRVEYMSNDCVLMEENEGLFPPIGEVYYSYYEDKNDLKDRLEKEPGIEHIVGRNQKTEFGKSNDNGLFEYADSVDVIQFLLAL